MESMDEHDALARAAVAALQAANHSKWTDVPAAVGSAGGLLQCGLIYVGLRQMGKASEERNRQLDQQAETLGKVGQALDRQGEVLAELLRRAK